MNVKFSMVVSGLNRYVREVYEVSVLRFVGYTKYVCTCRFVDGSMRTKHRLFSARGKFAN